MLVNFESLAPSSRIWVYQADREFLESELEIVTTKIEAFVAAWKRHGEGLKASYQIKYNQFIMLAVDEEYNGVSGCSIDSSVNLMKQFERAFDLDLTNKLNVSFKNNNNINVVSLADFQKFVKLGKINEETIVFNNMITTKEDLSNKWEVEAKESWHQKYLVS